LVIGDWVLVIIRILVIGISGLSGLGNSMKRLFFRGLVGALLLVAFNATVVPAQDVVGRIVAVVNGEAITLFELNQRFRPFLEQLEGRELSEGEKRELLEAKRRLLDRMVEEILLRQEAERLHMTVSDLEVQTQIRQLREEIGLTETQFLEQLRLQGLSKELYEQRLRDEIQRQRLLRFMVRRKVVVTSDEIRRYYESNQQEFSREHRVHLALILFASREQAENVLARVRGGELSFAEAARTYSLGPGAEQGGDIGKPAWRDLASDWRAALAGLAVGDISDIFLVQGRPAVLKYLAEKRGEVLPLAEVEEQIREKLLRPRLEERYAEYIAGLRSRALIDVRL
jgi:peptidyl-prolyl cis-trans isomerase SurA